MRYALLLTALLSGLAWLVVFRDSGERSAAPRPPARQPGPAVIALIGDEVHGVSGRLEGPHVARLLRISLPGGAIEAERPLGRRLRPDPTIATPGAGDLAFSGSLLAAGPEPQTVFVLVRQPRPARDQLAVLDATSLATRRRHPLPGGVDYSGMALGRSGRIYAYGARRVRRGYAPVLTVLDPRGALLDTRAVPGRTTRDWQVQWATPSIDERRAMLTYHGGNTTGADWLDLTRTPLRRCRGQHRDRACVFEVHGAVEAYRHGFLATTGSGVLEVSRNGRIVRRLPLEPRNVHLMDLVLEREHLFVSSCGKRPAIQRFDLNSDRVETLRSGRFCGAALAAGAGFLALAASRVDRFGYSGPNTGLRLVDLGEPGAGIAVPRRGRPLDAIIVE
jgi:hypothetical protein